MKTLTLIALTLIATGCSLRVVDPFVSDDTGKVIIEGDERGIGAFWQGANALVTNGMASPDMDTSAWQARKLFITTRAPGLQLGQSKNKAVK